MQLNETLKLAVLSERQYGPILTISAEQLRTSRREYLSSHDFVLVELPLYMAARVHRDAIGQRLLNFAASAQFDPIIVDVNVHKIGRTTDGFVPPIIVIEGHHRHHAASLAGRETISAWVGDQAARVLLEMIPDLKEIRANADEPVPFVGSTRMEAALALYAGGTKSVKLPAFNKSHLRSALARMSQLSPGKKKFGKKSRTKLRADANSPGSGVGQDLTREKVMKGDGDCRGCDKTLMGADYVKKIVTHYIKACKNGYKPEMKAVAPPGCEDMVKGLKDSDVDNPYAVAWWHHNTYGDCGGGKK